MALHEWTLITPNTSGAGQEFTIDAGDIAGTPARWRVSMRTLQSGLSQGVTVVEIDNGLLKTAIVPTRGMGIWRAWMSGQELGWKSPVRGPVHPAFVPNTEPGGLGWLAGFDELMCRCGLESNGAPDFDDRGRLKYPLHGRIANRPAHELRLTVDDVAGTIALDGVVEESRFHFQKLRMRTTYTTAFHSGRIAWRDEVENFGGTTAGMQMLYHTNIGQPQLDGGSKIVAPLKSVRPGNSDTATMGAENWDLYSAPQAGFKEQVYQLDLLSNERGETRLLLKNSSAASGVQLGFNVRQLPCFSLWRNLVAEADGYVTGIEPATNFPNPRSWEEQRGRVITLQPSERWAADLALDWFLDAASVARAEQSIREMQGTRQATVYADVIDS